MTKKHYQLIATAIADYNATVPLNQRIHLETFTTLHLMPKLKADNPKFDEKRFIEAALNRPF